MPNSLDPQLIAFEQQLYKGALILLPRTPSTTSSIAGKVLRFQYNPDSITRTRAGEWVDRNQQQGQRSTPSAQATSLASAQGGASLLSKSESISMKLVFDTTEQLLRGEEVDALGGTGEGMPREAGVLPQLALLEQVGLGAEQDLGDSTRSTPRPEPPSEILLVLGTARQFPVVITSVTITEQRFNAALVPTRAEVDLRMRVLEPVDVQYHGWVAEVFDTLVAQRQSRLAESTDLSVGAPEQLVEALYGEKGSLVRTFGDPSSQADPT
jgi:hypothetical protein